MDLKNISKKRAIIWAVIALIFYVVTTPTLFLVSGFFPVYFIDLFLIYIFAKLVQLFINI